MDMDFFYDNYVWFIVVGVILFMALIGYIAEKTNFGRAQFDKKVKTKDKRKREKKKSKKEELPLEPEDNEVVIEDPVTIEDENWINPIIDNNDSENETIEPIVEDFNAQFGTVNLESDELIVEENLNDLPESDVSEVETAPIEEDLNVPFGDETVEPVVEQVVEPVVDLPIEPLEDIIPVDSDVITEVSEELTPPNIESLNENGEDSVLSNVKPEKEDDEEDAWKF